MKKKSEPKQPRKNSAKPGSPGLPVIDRRALEGTMSGIARLLQSQNFSSLEEVNAFLASATGSADKSPRADTPLERAQEIINQAWGARGRRRAELARKALEISMDCADAYVLLAEETAKNAEEARSLYAQGVAAGERALGPAFFVENAGHFWGLLETRPYMRALEGLAATLWALGEKKQATLHLMELLRLNPHDNQGIRYLLARHLLSLGEDEELLKLLDQFKEDEMAEWLYTRALATFRTQGATKKAAAALHAGLAENPFVPIFLFGIKKLPLRPPGHYGYGDENEAALYVGSNSQVWSDTPGALGWFVEEFKKEAERAQHGVDKARLSTPRA